MICEACASEGLFRGVASPRDSRMGEKMDNIFAKQCSWVGVTGCSEVKFPTPYLQDQPDNEVGRMKPEAEAAIRTHMAAETKDKHEKHEKRMDIGK